MYKLVFYLTIFSPLISYAYIGPGMAGGSVLAILGILIALIIGLWGIIYYPVKRKFKSLRKKNSEDTKIERD